MVAVRHGCRVEVVARRVRSLREGGRNVGCQWPGAFFQGAMAMLLARRRWVGFIFVATAALAGCSDEEPGAARHEEGADDHAELALEGSDVSDSLDGTGVSPA